VRRRGYIDNLVGVESLPLLAGIQCLLGREDQHNCSKDIDH